MRKRFLAEEQSFDLRLLEPGDSFAGFSLGDAQFQPLKTFLKRDAKKFSEQLLAKTYVFAIENKVVAYVTLVCGEIASERDDIADLDGAEFHYDHYPAMKIARLAVSKQYRKYGLGRSLVDFSLGRTLEIAEIAGCRFVVVDAKQPSIKFYEKRGFRLLDTPENTERAEPLMFVDLVRHRETPNAA
ncbi:GNAT family N-acetyltransferase [Marivita sp.]|uniref:GNAT family N-acetyltransferase n=1 Tax=Marivita sp. TaxID=2003365 RepID=UPI003F71E03A